MMADFSQTGAGVVGVDDAGIHLSPTFAGSGDVYFDGHHAWSFGVGESGAAKFDHGLLVEWPRRMTPWLNGTSIVEVISAERVMFRDEVVFGDGHGRVRFVDKDGIPVMIDKWGLLQRPFSGRDPKVIEQIVDVTAQILEVMERDCGLLGWMAFGTLLGAAREGKVIGHDSDVDLAYLSEQPTPSEMATELYCVARALRRDGFQVQQKSASFITVVLKSADGGAASVDIYTCFHVGDLLYETATVRAAVPRAAILPLTELEFERRLLPAPADPDRMLTVSYGPRWRVPDPSFKHQPGSQVTERFEGWFGSLMRHRRDWERYLADRHDDIGPGPSEFAAWVGARLSPVDRVVEVGCGSGADALALAERGHEVLGLDYSRHTLLQLERQANRQGWPASFTMMNLYDLRDVLTRGALLARHRSSPQVVYARELLEALDPDGADNFWRFTRMALRAGGRLFLESLSMSRRDCKAWRVEHGGGRLCPVDPGVVEGDAVRHGGTVTHRSGFLEARAAARGGAPARWRMIVEWSSPS
jgi:SAM-dependent methyltransferase